MSVKLRRIFLWHLLAPAVCAVMLVGGPHRSAAQPDTRNYYPDRVWGKPSGAKMNVSAFAYRDVNRNGIYDVGDWPMAKVAFEMKGPRGSKVGMSNISGFANFAMSVMQTDVEIVDEGVYEFRAVPPPGWILTSDNQIQTTNIRILPGAPGDMVSSLPMSPFGFAPELTISGRVKSNGALTAMPIRVRAPNGKEQMIEPKNDGNFTISATRGPWTVIVADPRSGKTTERKVAVGSVPIQLSTILMDEQKPPASQGNSVVLGFDDLIQTNAVVELPSGYGGLSWRNWVVTHNRTYSGEGYINGTMSGEYVAYNSSGHPALIYSDRPFDFVGGHFAVAWADAEGETLRIRAFRGKELVAEDTLRLSYLGSVYFDAAYRGITRLEFATQHYWQAVVDDLSVRVPGTKLR